MEQREDSLAETPLDSLWETQLLSEGVQPGHQYSVFSVHHSPTSGSAMDAQYILVLLIKLHC